MIGNGKSWGLNILCWQMWSEINIKAPLCIGFVHEKVLFRTRLLSQCFICFSVTLWVLGCDLEPSHSLPNFLGSWEATQQCFMLELPSGAGMSWPAISRCVGRLLSSNPCTLYNAFVSYQALPHRLFYSVLAKLWGLKLSPKIWRQVN